MSASVEPALLNKIIDFALDCADSAGVKLNVISFYHGYDSPQGWADHKKQSIALSSGLLDSSWSEIEYVIAHEIGHLKEGRVNFLNTPRRIAVVLYLLGMILGPITLWLTLLMLPALTMLAMGLFRDWRQPILHQSEFEADLFAVRFCGMEGITAFAARVLESRADKECLTHPNWEARLKYVESRRLQEH